MGMVKRLSQPPVSDNCFAMTSRAFCSKCDADISTGQNAHGHLCLDFCDQWLLAC